jgi:hypothetical protein
MSPTTPHRDDPDGLQKRRPPSDASELEKKIVELAKIGVPGAILVLAVLAGLTMGASAVILVLAAGALCAVIAVFWASVRTLAGETKLSGADAYALGAPRAEEEQKRAVLRALKDLEFERSVGKISDEDYKALVAKYRAEAKRLLRVLDEEAQPHREQVEGLVNKRLRREGLLDDTGEPQEDAKPTEAGEAKAEAAPEKTKKRKKARPKPAPLPAPEEPAVDAVACKQCGTVNDEDAVFCKKCGARRASEQEEGAS